MVCGNDTYRNYARAGVSNALQRGYFTSNNRKRKDETDAAYASRLYGFPEYDEEEAYYDGQHLYQLLWQPLQKYLTVNGNIYITVSGVINTINVAAIPIAFNTYAGFNYNISQIGNSADLEKIKKQIHLNQVKLQ